MSDFWTRAVVAGGMIVLAALLAKAIDGRLANRSLTAAAATRYKVLRRSIFSTIVFVGVFSALLVIPQVRAIAGGILASSAVLAVVLGFAAQRTLGNFIAGLLIAFTQPVRLGDEVEVGGECGVVEEIGLTYTWVRTRDNDRLVIPNEKLASDTIRNSTIRSPETLAEVKVQVPLSADLRAVVRALEEGPTEAFVTDLCADDATITVRTWVPTERHADRAASDLRLTVHDRLRELGVVGAV
jgi:small-conductance mechanosensitive channel